MPEVINWKTRPIFITSTFRDMHAERDYLRTRVFPVLEEQLRERFHHLEVIDLRWGVESSVEEDLAAREVLILKVCLNEIKRSRPFLIGLLGDRYGWVPPIERMKTAAGEAGFDHDLTAKSVTELEILYGVLESQEQQQRSWFYLRDLSGYDRISPEKAAKYSDEYDTDPDAKDRKIRLDVLKERLENEIPERVRHYRGQWNPNGQCVIDLKEWGEQVLEDLWSDLERETAEYLRQAPQTWQDQETEALEEFVEGRTRGFVGRRIITQDLLDLALSPDAENTVWAACVTGAPGTGKSSLFGYLYRQLQGNDDIIVLAHAAGTSPKSNYIDSMLRCWVYTLAKELGQTDPLDDSSSLEDVENEFSRLLGQAALQKRIVFLIDALNQFESTTQARFLTWLPTLWPDNARLIATAIGCDASETLINNRRAREVPVPLLAEQEAAEIARTICQRYHRQLNQDVLRVLLDKRTADNQPATGNALWLELAIEELNLLDADAFARGERKFADITDPEQRLQALLIDTAKRMPPDVSGLYSWMIDRAEKLFGQAWTQTFVNLIAVSRSGWRESDLCELMPKLSQESWDDLHFATLRRAFRAHVIQRGSEGQWDFFHTQMRLTVEQRMHQKDIAPKAIHKAIVDHLEALSGETDTLRQTELMFHLIGLDDRLRAATYYGGVFYPEEQTGATKVLADYILSNATQEPNPGLEYAKSLLVQGDLSNYSLDGICHRYNFDLSDALADHADLKTRAALLEPTLKNLVELARSDPGNADRQRDLSASYRNIGNVQLAQGDLSGALKSYQSFMEISERLATSHLGNAGLQQNLSASYNNIGHVQRAQGDLSSALKSYQSSMEISERLAAADPGNADLQRGLSISYDRIGNVQLAQGDLSGALKSYQSSVEIRERLAASDPGNMGWQRDLWYSYNNIGDVQSDQGDISGALKSYQSSMEIVERLAASDPGNAGWQRDLSVSYNNIGDVQRAQGDISGALIPYQSSMEIRERLAASDPGNMGWQHDLTVSYDRIGDVQSAQRDLSGALKLYQSSMEISKRLVASDPGNANWQRGLSVSYYNIGNVQRAQRDLSGALKSYQSTHEILKRLAASDPSNAGWQRDLWVSCSRIATVLQKSGASEAIGWWQRAYDVLSDMKARGLFVSPKDEQVLQQLRTKLGL